MKNQLPTTPLTNQISCDVASEVQERFRALHARLSRYEKLIDEKDARIAELEA